jgi:L-ribulose-5-phosphate 3-epimerase UlaE
LEVQKDVQNAIERDNIVYINDIRKIIKIVTKNAAEALVDFIYEINTQETRDNFVKILTEKLKILIENKHVCWYEIISDEIINTLETINKNKLCFDLYFRLTPETNIFCWRLENFVEKNITNASLV